MTTSMEKIKSFIKPNKTKVIVFIIFLFYAFGSFIMSPWGHSSSPLPILLFFPLSVMGGLALLLVFPYAYIVACISSTVFSSIKDRKLFLIAALLILFFLLGMDEPLINSTINKPDYSCTVNSDCVVKSISKGWCGNPQCVNENWEYYDSMINNVFALSCNFRDISCICEQNICENRLLEDNRDVLFCKSIEKQEIKDKCYFYTAINLNTPDLCEELSDEFLRERCSIDGGIKNKNTEFCHRMIGELEFSRVRHCFVNANETEWKPLLCFKYKDWHDIESCLNDFEYEGSYEPNCEQFDQLKKDICHEFRRECTLMSDNTPYWGNGYNLKESCILENIEFLKTTYGHEETNRLCKTIKNLFYQNRCLKEIGEPPDPRPSFNSIGINIEGERNVGSKIVLSDGITNNGQDFKGELIVKWLINGEDYDIKVIKDVKIQTTIVDETKTEWIPMKSGTYTITFIIDPENKIDELYDYMHTDTEIVEISQ